MRIVVLGAGAVGGYFGARLAAAGEDVSFIARGAHAEAMRRDGLRVLSEGGDILLPDVRVLDDPANAGVADIVLVAVKMYDLADAAARLGSLVSMETAVVPFQNGVEASLILQKRLGRRPVCGGVVYIGGHIEAPGVIRHQGRMARLVFGELDGSRSWRLEALAAACEAAGIEALLSERVQVEQWKKFVFLAPFAGITCLIRGPVGAVRDDPAAWARFEALVRETVAVGRAQGVPLPDDIVEERLALVRGLPPAMRSSMLADLEAGRRLELDWLTGAVVRLGRSAGIAVPASEEVLAALTPQAGGRA
jgi:2-dehydropantoate 2-reductase